MALLFPYGEIFLVHNRISLRNGISLNGIDLSFNDAYLPIYNLPKDACFVIRQTELNKLFNWLAGKNHPRIFNAYHPSITTILACL
jgi:hypothetical protein